MKEGFVEADGHKLFFRFIHKSITSPDEPLLVFLHEGLGSIPQWKHFPEKFCAYTGLSGLVYERYGYGQSDKLQEIRDSGYLERAGLKEFPELIRNLGIVNPLILFGHSDGGSVALLAATQKDLHVIGVITEAAHIFLEDISVNGIQEAIEKFEKGRLRILLEKYHGEGTESMFYGWAATWTAPEFRHWSLEKYLPEIHCPVFAIQGEDDEYGSPAQVEGIIKGCKGYTESWLIPGCGHSPHIQKEKEVMERCATFLKRILDGTSA